MPTNLTKEQAIDLTNTKWWESKTDREIVQFQLFEDRLCMPFDRFHEALESALGRPVFTHELAYVENIRSEFLGGKPAPTFEDNLTKCLAEHFAQVIREEDEALPNIHIKCPNYVPKLEQPVALDRFSEIEIANAQDSDLDE